MPSTLRTGAVPRSQAIALAALTKIAEDAAVICGACRELRAEVAARRPLDPSADREHMPFCAGATAWPALAEIHRVTAEQG